jgi:hypothetical protein
MIKIFIPCYKRLVSLRWVVISLLDALKNIGTEAKVFIVNNNPDDKENVEHTIFKIRNDYSDKIDIQVIHREKSLPPVYSWYGAIVENTEEDDIVFIQGDDDLFLRDGIKYRVESIISSGADILLSNYIGGLVFSKNDEKAIFSNINSLRNEVRKGKFLTLSDSELIGGIFLGNNCYKYNNNFKESLKLAFQWCDEQEWIDENIRTHFLPFYLPLAAVYLGSKVYYTDKICVIRGININEIKKSKYGASGWTNPGFISLLCLGVLNNNYLSQFKELDIQRSIANTMAAKWFLTYCFGQYVNKKVCQITFKRIGYPKFNIILIFQSLKFFLVNYFKDLIGIRYYFALKRLKRNSISIDELLGNLKKIN